MGEYQEALCFRPRSYADVKALAKHLKKPVVELLAMAPGNDPFYAGVPARREKAEWFAAIWQQFAFTTAVHVRRIHYRIVSQPVPLQKPNGMPYENTIEDWNLLSDASKAARCLQLVPADLIIDQRNPEAFLPEGFGDEPFPPRVFWGDVSLSWYLPAMRDLEGDMHLGMPAPALSGYDYSAMAQPVHIELLVEKSTMNDILAPLCQELFCSLSPASGFTSITRCIDVLKRNEAMGKPTRIFYVSDFDPAGSCMAPSVARQIEYWIEQYAADADIKLQPLVLTREQVDTYTLPRIPIKESDVRKAGFEERHGTGAVELDALEALVPGELERIVREAIAPYRDPDLEERYYDAGREAQRQVREAWEQHTADLREDLASLRAEVDATVQDFAAEYEDLRRRFAAALAPHAAVMEALTEQVAEAQYFFTPDLPPAPASPLALPDEHDWLFDSQRDYLTQLAHYHAHKHGGGCQEEDGSAAD